MAQAKKFVEVLIWAAVLTVFIGMLPTT